MVNLLRAEWIKTVKNYALTSFLVWMLPVGFASLIIIFAVTGFLSETMKQVPSAFSAGSWTHDMIGIWSFVINFPANLFGRVMPLAFMAVGFAGEYQWGTWKNIIPRNRRPALIMSKLVIQILVVMISLILTSLIAGVGWSVSTALHDMPYGPRIDGDVLNNFLELYLQTALIGFLSITILGGFAALAAIITRSILGGLLLSSFFSVVDTMSLGALMFFRNLLNIPKLINLYQFTPTYNMDNLSHWFRYGSTQSAVAPGFTAELSMGASYAILMIWIVGLVSLSIITFQRQDISS
jgi:hypothetical protein